MWWNLIQEKYPCTEWIETITSLYTCVHMGRPLTCWRNRGCCGDTIWYTRCNIRSLSHIALENRKKNEEELRVKGNQPCAQACLWHLRLFMNALYLVWRLYSLPFCGYWTVPVAGSRGHVSATVSSQCFHYIALTCILTCASSVSFSVAVSWDRTGAGLLFVTCSMPSCSCLSFVSIVVCQSFISLRKFWSSSLLFLRDRWSWLHVDTIRIKVNDGLPLQCRTWKCSLHIM